MGDVAGEFGRGAIAMSIVVAGLLGAFAVGALTAVEAAHMFGVTFPEANTGWEAWFAFLGVDIGLAVFGLMLLIIDAIPVRVEWGESE